MPSFDTGRELTADLPEKVDVMTSTNRSAEVGCEELAPIGAKSGSVGQESIEYWFFCGDGVAMRVPR